MSGTFKRGDLVAHRLCTGTVQSGTKSALRVRWDDSGLTVPADPQELVHATEQKEGRSTLAKESATALTDNPSEKESVMNNHNGQAEFSEDELHAEVIRRGATLDTTVQELCLWAIDLNLAPSVVLAAYEAVVLGEQGGNRA